MWLAVLSGGVTGVGEKVCRELTLWELRETGNSDGGDVIEAITDMGIEPNADF